MLDLRSLIRPKYISILLMFIILILLTTSLTVCASSESEVVTKQIEDKVQLKQSLSEQDAILQDQLKVATDKQETAHQQFVSCKENYDKAKTKFDIASTNIDMVASDTLAQIAEDYRVAKRKFEQSETEFNTATNDKNGIQEKAQRIKLDIQKNNEEIQRLKADLFDLKLQEPVWAEGYAEVVQSEDKTPIQCRELVEKLAKRDAVERGGKALIQSITRVEMFQVKEDTITLSSYAQIIGSDDSGDWGKVHKVIEGDVTKFIVKVRVQITAANAPNPFRNIKSSPAPAISLRSPVQQGELLTNPEMTDTASWENWELFEWVKPKQGNEEVIFLNDGGVRFLADNGNEYIGIRQKVDLDASAYSSLILTATIRADSQRLSGTGWQGREAPIAIFVVYTDVNGVLHNKLPICGGYYPAEDQSERMYWHGFYYVDPDGNSLKIYGSKINRGMQYKYTVDLMQALSPKPKLIHYVGAGGSGWPVRDGTILRLSLQGNVGSN